MSGVLKAGSSDTLVVTASSVNEGALLTLQQPKAPIAATQLFIVAGSYIRLAANPNLVFGPGPTANKELILVDLTKASNATDPTLRWAGMQNNFAFTLAGTGFTNVQFANPALQLYADVVTQPTNVPGAALGLWKFSGTPNQFWSYALVPPVVPSITLYDIANLTGQSVTLTADNNNLNNQSFANRTSSLQVNSGKWILYVGTDYPGLINELWVVSADGGPQGDGKYQLAAQWGDWATDGNRICSARPLPPTGIVLYENPWFGGRSVNITADSADTGTVGFQNLVSAIVVVTGTWRVFTQTGYNGNSVLVYPKGGLYESGFYPQNIQWGGDNDAVRSLRIERS